MSLHAGRVSRWLSEETFLCSKPMKSADPRRYERDWRVRALRGIVRFYAHAWHRTQVISPSTLPADGPAILICNHSAGIDPLLLQATCPRVITWMIAREYYELPVLHGIFQRLGYIPVSRGMRDSASIKLALRTLDAGKVLGIFPEGRIETSQALLPFQPGAATIAARAGVPIYPAYIAGIQRNLGIGRAMVDRQDVTIAYGRPIAPSGKTFETVDLEVAVQTLRERTIFARNPLGPPHFPQETK